MILPPSYQISHSHVRECAFAVACVWARRRNGEGIALWGPCSFLSDARGSIFCLSLRLFFLPNLCEERSKLTIHLGVFATLLSFSRLVF